MPPLDHRLQYNMGPTSMSPDEIGLIKTGTTQTITRKGTFDSGHRVMNERMKCFNLHGHTYLYELEFEFSLMEDIGYAIDFKEIKRIGSQWIDDMFDHGMFINPKDEQLILLCANLNSKKWIMSLNGIDGYCNPSVENISKELFLSISELLNGEYLKLKNIRLYETPNCYTDCNIYSITKKERGNFYSRRLKELIEYKQNKGVIEYDDRKI